MTRRVSSLPFSSDALDDLTRWSIALVAFFLVAGYEAASLLLTMLPDDARSALFDSSPVSLAASDRQWLWFFGRNIAFFLVVSITPMINWLLVATQVFIIGLAAGLISGESWPTQVEILYRHGILEIVAICVAMFISLRIWSAVRVFVSSPIRDTARLGGELRSMAPYYGAIGVLTLMAALLEGSIHAAL